MQLIFTDSGEYKKAKNNYLPGGLLNCIRENIVNVIDEKKMKIDIKGK